MPKVPDSNWAGIPFAPWWMWPLPWWMRRRITADGPDRERLIRAGIIRNIRTDNPER